jgi:lysophospholipase L1-like esterase
MKAISSCWIDRYFANLLTAVSRGRTCVSMCPKGPFRSLVVLGESAVQGGGWLTGEQERWADIAHQLVKSVQEQPLEYHNAGLGACVISPRSPGYSASVKPSALEWLDDEVIARNPDLIVVSYGLNDMRAGMPLGIFREDMEELIDRLGARLSALVVLTNIYHITTYAHYPPFNRGNLRATKRYNRMLETICHRRGCHYADIWRAEAVCDHLVHPDTVHANKIGNLVIAYEVFRTIALACPGLADRIIKRDWSTQWTAVCLRYQREERERSEHR